MLQHGSDLNRSPTLKPLGNLGDKRMLSALGDEHVSQLQALYKGRAPGGPNLVPHWFEKARAQLQVGRRQARAPGGN